MGLAQAEDGRVHGHQLTPNEIAVRDPYTNELLVLDEAWLKLPLDETVEAPANVVAEVIMGGPEQLAMAAGGVHHEAEAHQAKIAA